MKKLLSLLGTFIIICSCIMFTGCQNPASDIVVRFSVASDVHVTSSDSVEASRLKKLFNDVENFSSSNNYKNYDMAVFCGDFTNDGSDDQLRNFKNVCDSNLSSNTKLQLVLGNHEFYGNSNPRGAFKQMFNTEADYVTKLNGYNFIFLSPVNSSQDNAFSQEQVEWLDNRLFEFTTKEPQKPVFVFQHHHVTGTVYGSENWGTDILSGVLNKYKQVIDFSGHSHYSINDPRSIHQDKFTSLGTGTLSYSEILIENRECFPVNNSSELSYSSEYKDCAQYYICEVKSNNIVDIIGYDLLTNKKIVTYSIDINNFNYKFELRKQNIITPVFNNLSIKADEIGGEVYLTVNQAVAGSGDKIVYYKYKLKNDNNIVKQNILFSNYYKYPLEDKLIFNIGVVSGEYTLELEAYSAFGYKCSHTYSFNI